MVEEGSWRTVSQRKWMLTLIIPDMRKVHGICSDDPLEQRGYWVISGRLVVWACSSCGCSPTLEASSSETIKSKTCLVGSFK